MKMELIQPFINAADAVLAQGLQSPMSIGNLSMEQEAYRRKGVAALVAITGDIEGRIVFDLDPETAVRVASHFAGAELPESDDLVRETVCELANQVTGNAVTALNDQGFHFRVHPPVLHTSEHGPTSSEDTEALVICCETDRGSVFMNIALRYNDELSGERAAARRVADSDLGLRTSALKSLAPGVPRTLEPSINYCHLERRVRTRLRVRSSSRKTCFGARYAACDLRTRQMQRRQKAGPSTSLGMTE